MAPSADDAERAAVAAADAERAAAEATGASATGASATGASAKGAKGTKAKGAMATGAMATGATPAKAAGGPVPLALEPGLDRRDRATLLAWLTLSRTGALATEGSPAATSLAWYDELRLPGALVAGLHDTGFEEGDAWQVTDRVRVLLALPRPSTIGGSARTADARLMKAWLASESVRVAIGVNTWEGVEYVDRDRFLGLLDWAVRLDTIESELDAFPGSVAPTTDRAKPDLIARLAAKAAAVDYRVDRLLAPRSPAKPA
jgi:hypothetical protein